MHKGIVVVLHKIPDVNAVATVRGTHATIELREETHAGLGAFGQFGFPCVYGLRHFPQTCGRSSLGKLAGAG